MWNHFPDASIASMLRVQYRSIMIGLRITMDYQLFRPWCWICWAMEMNAMWVAYQEIQLSTPLSDLLDQSFTAFSGTAVSLDVQPIRQRCCHCLSFLHGGVASLQLNPPAPEVQGAWWSGWHKSTKVQVYLGGGPLFGKNLLFLIGRDARLHKTL